MQFTVQQLVKACRNVCAIREFGERMHENSITGQILGFVNFHASMHRGHGHSIEEGGKS
jgi:hypothetical protein